jgi:hypothetical protein
VHGWHHGWLVKALMDRASVNIQCCWAGRRQRHDWLMLSKQVAMIPSMSVRFDIKFGRETKLSDWTICVLVAFHMDKCCFHVEF